MTAGHILMHILSSGVLSIFVFPYIGPLLSILPLVIYMSVCFMELGISFLQAYVFFMLIVLYFNESIHTSQYQENYILDLLLFYIHYFQH